MRFLWTLYAFVSTRKPIVALVALFALLALPASHFNQFRLDASADALLLEDDQDLKYYREVVARYGALDFLAVAFTPKDGQLFAETTLNQLRNLQDRLASIDGVKDVLSLLNAPLFRSPPLPLTQLAAKKRTLISGDTDAAMAQVELLESPIYRDLLISRDGRSAMLIVNYAPDPRYDALLVERERLRNIKHRGDATAADLDALERIDKEFFDYRAVYLAKDKKRIAAVRDVIRRHNEGHSIFLGGVPMIVNDMIGFIQNDLWVFSGAVLLFLVITLALIFRDPRWIAIALMSSLLPAATMFGVLGMLNWEITVISSNFASLLLIIIMSMTVHIIVRYRENQITRDGDESPTQTIQRTMRYMFKPCIYTSLTTIAAFVSLIVSGIRPVIDFGYTMSLGIVLAFVFVFVFLPNMIRLTQPRPASTAKPTIGGALTTALARIAISRTRVVLVVGVAVFAFSVAGALRLDVENRFIDYFSEETEVHQGMLKIDRHLGGTTPFDLIVKAPTQAQQTPPAKPAPPAESDEDDIFGDILGDDYLETSENDAATFYWLKSPRVERLKKIHDMLEAMDATGKVLSIVTLIRVLEAINGGALSDLDLAFIPRMLPDEVRHSLLSPYLSADGSEARFNVRIIDSDPELSRKIFLETVNEQVTPHVEAGETARATGALVLYNNMLQSLFESQILTLGSVLLVIMLMFVVLFRSFALALIGIIPSTIAASLILGLMGWLGIPLDLMTITIAAITIGIAVDNTIHYIVRFKRELPQTRDGVAAVRRCHASIGSAVYFTSLIIVVGFSILSLSNFTPTVYFGMLTSIAMLAALFATLTLLPALLITFRPVRIDAEQSSRAASSSAP